MLSVVVVVVVAVVVALKAEATHRHNILRAIPNKQKTMTSRTKKM